MPGEGFPEINNCDDVSQAAKQYGDDPAMRRYIMREAIDKGCVDRIPDEWGVEIDNGRGKDDTSG